MANISDKINELEMGEHFDDLVRYANEQASPIEKALLYINILDVFVPALGFPIYGHYRECYDCCSYSYRDENSTQTKH